MNELALGAEFASNSSNLDANEMIDRRPALVLRF